VTDDTTPPRPRPAYGEYATPEEVAALTNRPVPTPAVPQAPIEPKAPAPSVAASPPVRLPLADRMLTGLLLGFGFVVTLLVTSSAFGLDQGFQNIYDQYGLGTYVPPFPLSIIGAILVISHVGLFVVALVGTIRLTRQGKPAWWVALVAGIVAAAVFWVTMLSLMFSDEKLVEAVRVATGS
jgi:hypothetical protein